MLETISPAYGIAKGKGPMSALASSGAMGLVPALVARPQRKKLKLVNQQECNKFLLKCQVLQQEWACRK